MVDLNLPIYPDSYLPAKIVHEEVLDCNWTIYFLENEEIWYADSGGYLFKLLEEQIKWSVNTGNQRVRDIALSVDTAIKNFRRSTEM
jgi:hypothetical protein